MDTMANQSCGTVPNTVISIPGHRPADVQLHNKCFVAPKGKKIPVRLPGKAVVTVDFHQAGTPQGKATEWTTWSNCSAEVNARSAAALC